MEKLIYKLACSVIEYGERVFESFCQAGHMFSNSKMCLYKCWGDQYVQGGRVQGKVHMKPWSVAKEKWPNSHSILIYVLNECHDYVCFCSCA